MIKFLPTLLFLGLISTALTLMVFVLMLATGDFTHLLNLPVFLVYDAAIFTLITLMVVTEK